MKYEIVLNKEKKLINKYFFRNNKLEQDICMWHALSLLLVVLSSLFFSTLCVAPFPANQYAPLT
jgi:hypothetical protein